MYSAFGVEHEISKGLPRALRVPGKSYSELAGGRYEELGPAGKATVHRLAAHSYGKDIMRMPGVNQDRMLDVARNQRALSRRQMMRATNKKQKRVLP